MFITRLLSGIVLMLAALFLLISGGPWLLVALGFLSLIGIYELLRVLKMERHPITLVAYVGTLVQYVMLYVQPGRWTMGIFMASLVIMLIIYVCQYPAYRVEKVTYGIFSMFYVGYMLSYIYQTRCLENGHWFVWLIVIGAWGSDTCAYVVGMLFGKHHFSDLSPKKTIEGCIGGVVGAGVIGFVVSLFFPYTDAFTIPTEVVFPLVVMIAAVISQFGDLAASAIKRNYGIKDYGKLIPGHGGVLDRFDSVIFVAPFVYYLLVLSMYF